MCPIYILTLGKTVFVPKIVKSEPVLDSVTPIKTISRMDMFRIYSEEDFTNDLVPGVWGIREPGEEFEGRTRLNRM